MRRLGWLFLGAAAALQASNVVCLFFLEGAGWATAALALGSLRFAVGFMVLSFVAHALRSRTFGALPLALYGASLPVVFRPSQPAILALMAAAVPLAFYGLTLVRGVED